MRSHQAQPVDRQASPKPDTWSISALANKAPRTTARCARSWPPGGPKGGAAHAVCDRELSHGVWQTLSPSSHHRGPQGRRCFFGGSQCKAEKFCTAFAQYLTQSHATCFAWLRADPIRKSPHEHALTAFSRHDERVLRHNRASPAALCRRLRAGMLAMSAGCSAASRCAGGQAGRHCGRSGYVLVSREYLDAIGVLSRVGAYCHCARSGGGECGPANRASCGE